MSGLTIDHAVTRTVRDSAALLDAVAGPALGDPYWAPPQERPYAEEVGADPGHLRIAFTHKRLYGEEPIDPDCVAAVEDAAKLCAELGHEVVEAAPAAVNGEQLLEAFTIMWEAGTANGIDSVAVLTGQQPSPDMVEPLTWALYQDGKKRDASAYLTAVANLQLMSRGIAQFHEQYDLWLTPTLGMPPLPLGSFEGTPDNPRAGFDKAGEFVPFTPIQNATGQPGMSVPLYWNDAGLPIGVHFVGRFGDEATLFRVAAQLEEARPWGSRRPAVSAV